MLFSQMFICSTCKMQCEKSERKADRDQKGDKGEEKRKRK